MKSTEESTVKDKPAALVIKTVSWNSDYGCTTENVIVMDIIFMQTGVSSRQEEHTANSRDALMISALVSRWCIMCDLCSWGPLPHWL